MSDTIRDMTGQNRDFKTLLAQVSHLQNIDKTSHSGGGGGDDMRERVAKLEAGQEAIHREMEQQFRSVHQRFDSLDQKMLTKWDVAQVVFVVVGLIMAAAIFGPRVASLLPSVAP